MKYAYTSQIDRIAEERGLGQRGSGYPANTLLVYSVAVYDAPDDVTIYQHSVTPLCYRPLEKPLKRVGSFAYTAAPYRQKGGHKLCTRILKTYLSV